MTGYAVFAETKDGRTVLLASFRTKEQAEEYRVRLADWKRIWIEEFPPKKQAAS